MLVYCLGVQDFSTQLSAILHDIPEDSDVDFEYLEKRFGQEVSEIVSHLTRSHSNTKIYSSRMEEKIQENLGLLKAPYQARIIKCADRIDNLMRIDMLRKDSKAYSKVPYWIEETRVSILPIAKKTSKKAYVILKQLVDKYSEEFPFASNQLA
jgi:GTP pyrophosphokinase